MTKKWVKKALAFVAVLVLLSVLWLMFCGWQWSWGPFGRLHDLKTKNLAGNSEQYGLQYVPRLDESPLQGARIGFLGSSVTYGSASMGVSFAEYIEKRNDCKIIKEAVSGTTLVDSGIGSYIERMQGLDTSIPLDLFVCQLSTNDATQDMPMGEISASFVLEAFDTATVTGAMEYITCYAQQTWGCQVVFYTNAHYNSETYGAMVARLLELEEKWDIGIIDLWNDSDFNSITNEQRTLYMADSIHPTQAGYLEWWTPTMEAYLYQYAGTQE